MKSGDITLKYTEADIQRLELFLHGGQRHVNSERTCKHDREKRKEDQGEIHLSSDASGLPCPSQIRFTRLAPVATGLLRG